MEEFYCHHETGEEITPLWNDIYLVMDMMYNAEKLFDRIREIEHDDKFKIIYDKVFFDKLIQYLEMFTTRLMSAESQHRIKVFHEEVERRKNHPTVSIKIGEKWKIKETE